MAILVVAAFIWCAEHVADACGCLSPPDPAVTPGDYAVNQSGEQIIFEVTAGWVTAHVLIRYAGDPTQFAWLVPVPEAPDLSISPVSAFGLLDQATSPSVVVETNDLCPQSPWQCHYDEPSHPVGCGMAADSAAQTNTTFDAGAAASDAASGQPPVTVIASQTVGDYQTVTFSATDAGAATAWLQSNGFIVNSTTSIYMESYIQQNMVFVAAKLVPGASTTAIAPLRMHYRAAYPSIPLILTAVAAQPHLTVTAFVFGDQPFAPMGLPVVTVPQTRIAADPHGRVNYPMVLSRAVDDAGGSGFAVEYRGTSDPSAAISNSCCSGDGDVCGLGNNGVCECPAAAFDQSDCASQPDLVAGAQLLQTLASTYSTLTRITTRLSPEQMTFDPTFAPDYDSGLVGIASLVNVQDSLASCAASVVDQATYAADQARQGCAAMYCGIGAECVITASGPACACGDGQVAQQFTDEDNQPSVTCVPATPTVDLRAGGAILPDACGDASCGDGECIDRNGIPVCACNTGAAATLGSLSPLCAPIISMTGSPGAEDFSGALAELAVCTPPPPQCYGAKLEYVGAQNPGVECGNSTPPVDDQYQPSSGGCRGTKAQPPLAFFAGSLVVLVLVLRRRRGVQ
ncbi:MAG TPA: DUF2330 domain-containing protein [Kofleriaceae bacterium]|nr:DUF2330 domain-containing protein [Kofleriaceae bacterium]